MEIPKLNFDREKWKLTIRPYRDWAVILGGFFLLLVLIALSHLLLFRRFSRAGEITLEEIVETQVKIISEKDLRTTIERFDRQAELFEGYYKSRPAIIDPAK